MSQDGPAPPVRQIELDPARLVSACRPARNIAIHPGPLTITAITRPRPTKMWCKFQPMNKPKHMLAAAFALCAVAGTAHAQDRNGYWYYCASARAYYPYVQNCAEGWQRVASWERANETKIDAPQQLTPSLKPKAHTTEQQSIGSDSSAFTAGTEDRKAWETWFASLSGDIKDGAEWWANHRSDKPQPKCTDLIGDQQQGCAEAKLRLSIPDKLRRQSMDYRRGWNDYVASPPTVASPSTVTAVMPAPVRPEPPKPPKPFAGEHQWWSINQTKMICVSGLSPQQMISESREQNVITDTAITHNTEAGYENEIVSVTVSATLHGAPVQAIFYTDYHMAKGNIITGREQCETAVAFENNANGRQEGDNLN